MSKLASPESILTNEGRELLDTYHQRKRELEELYQQSNRDVCNNYGIQRDNVFRKYKRDT